MLRGSAPATTVMWGSDYPRGDSTWPHSRETVERNFAGMARDVVELVTSRNLTALYRLAT
ncbi:MAG: hypothetical protein J4F45_13460 [Pseudomonadales bacterium]|nr:hypothetical protein [Pseudomonadales bacterium]